MLTWALALMLTVAPLTLSAGDDQGFLAAINSTRSAAGLGSVQLDANLSAHARAHSAFMAEGNCAGGESICHSADGALRAAAGDWTKLGENVGRGATVASIHQAFLDSPSHRANMLGDYTHIGIGTDTHDGSIYVTVVFAQRAETTTTTTAPPPTTSIEPTTTTTGQPSTTTRPSITADHEPSTTTQGLGEPEGQPLTNGLGSIRTAIVRAGACLPRVGP